jgi:hypothetical protein
MANILAMRSVSHVVQGIIVGGVLGVCHGSALDQ